MQPELAEFIRDLLIKRMSDDNTSFYEVQAETPTGNSVTVAMNISEGIPTGTTYSRKTERTHQAGIELFGHVHPYLRVTTRQLMSELEAFEGTFHTDERGTEFQITEVIFTRQNYSRDQKQDYETSTINLTFTVMVRSN